MKIAFISDVHSNLEALTSVRKSLQNVGIDKVLFLGDIVGYGANPNECIEIIKDLSDDILAGNHDWAAVGKSSAEYFNLVAKEAIEWTQDKLTEQNKAFLSSLALKGEWEELIFVHATPSHPEEWNYIFNIFDATDNFETFSQPLCFVAHSHQPVIFVQTKTGSISSKRSTYMTLQKDFRYIINSGSVGQPRDGNPLSSYGIYDTEKKEYRLIRVQYDVTRAQKKILDAGLPSFLASRLGMGR
jgi:diadenosine tetraphosphatase ApaH/serine/threonine PP2A family protein phosphatase